MVWRHSAVEMNTEIDFIVTGGVWKRCYFFEGHKNGIFSFKTTFPYIKDIHEKKRQKKRFKLIYNVPYGDIYGTEI